MRSMARLDGRTIGRAYLLSIAVWTLFALLNAWEYHIFDQDLNIHTSFLERLVLSESRALAMALLTPPLFYFVRRQAGARRQSLSVLLYAAGIAPFMLLDASLRWIILGSSVSLLARYTHRGVHSPLDLIRSGFADQITTYIAIIVAAHAYVYFDRARKQEMERYEFQQALAASELQALKMQLHPHFLFNTLNGISTLIDSDRSSAKQMILKLSSLLRTVLQHSGSDLITLQEELKFVGEYLDLEKMRLGARLTVTSSIARETSEALVPQLILQPLVENAIRHGIGSSRERGWIEISSRLDGDTIELRVRNSVGEARRNGTGVGLRNTEARLRHLYSGEGALSFELGDDGTATTTLSIPALGIQRPACAS